MNINPNDELLESPFDDLEEEDSLVIDMTNHADIEGVAIRVELRRTRDPATGAVSPAKKLLDSNYIIGLIRPEDLPREGQHFRMPYHNFNSLADYGSVDSQEPISGLTVEDDCYYFSTTEGQWRLKVLDAGN